MGVVSPSLFSYSVSADSKGNKNSQRSESRLRLHETAGKPIRFSMSERGSRIPNQGKGKRGAGRVGGDGRSSRGSIPERTKCIITPPACVIKRIKYTLRYGSNRRKSKVRAVQKLRHAAPGQPNAWCHKRFRQSRHRLPGLQFAETSTSCR